MELDDHVFTRSCLYPIYLIYYLFNLKYRAISAILLREISNQIIIFVTV